ncbi:MAG: glycosyltransferase family 4 protein [Crocinitomicaceae bacterium]
MKANKKLLLIGGSKGNVHLLNYQNLISSYFDDILIVSNHEVLDGKGPSIHFGLKNPIDLWRNVRALRKIILEFQPDIVHVHQANAYGLITCLANRGLKPVVLTTWGSDVLTLPHRSILHRMMVKYILKRADFITADAQFMADAVHQLIGQKPVLVANFGVEILDNDVRLERENVIYSNRMHESLYQIDQIIRQSATFLKHHPDWKLRIAASGSETEKLQEIASEVLSKDQYEFIGFQSSEENRKNYLRSKIYVSIPNTDGTSISLLEALAYGCIPIVSDLPANLEWIANGKNGIVSSGHLSEELEEILQLDATTIQAYNSNIIEERASKKANKIKFEAIYDRIFSREA